MADGQAFRTEVEIFGDTYTLVGDSSPEEMLQIAKLVNNVMKQLSERNARLSKTQVSMLAALNMADELVKMKVKYDGMVRLLEPEKKKHSK